MKPEPLSILLIQGRHATAHGFAASMTRLGARVASVREGGHGQVEARIHRYDCVVIDLGDAWESAVVVRALRLDTTVPVIVIAATECAASRISALDAGADGCIASSLPAQVMRAHIAACSRRARMRPGNARILVG